MQFQSINDRVSDYQLKLVKDFEDALFKCIKIWYERNFEPRFVPQNPDNLIELLKKKHISLCVQKADKHILSSTFLKGEMYQIKDDRSINVVGFHNFAFYFVAQNDHQVVQKIIPIHELEVFPTTP
jgi:hypothetical protein